MPGLAILLAALAAAPVAADDVVILRSGERVPGVVVEEDPVAGVRILLPDGTLRSYPRLEVYRVVWAGSEPAQPPLRRRGPVYLRLRAGIPVGASVRLPGRTMRFGPAGEVPFTTLGAGIGWATGDHLAIGGEWSIGYTLHFVDEHSEAYDRDLVLQHFGVVATYYPFKQRIEEWPDVPAAPEGLFLSAGIAAAHLKSAPDEFEPPGRPTWRETGIGLLAGGGWAWRFAFRTDWTVTGSLDVAWDRFSSSDPTAPEGALSFRLDAGIDFF